MAEKLRIIKSNDPNRLDVYEYYEEDDGEKDFDFDSIDNYLSFPSKEDESNYTTKDTVGNPQDDFEEYFNFTCDEELVGAELNSDFDITLNIENLEKCLNDIRKSGYCIRTCLQQLDSRDVKIEVLQKLEYREQVLMLGLYLEELGKELKNYVKN